MKPSQLWRFHSSSAKYSCSNPLINVCLADVSMETVFTAPQCSKNGSKVIRAPGEWKWHRYDGQRRWLTGVDLRCLIQHVCSLCPHSAPTPHLSCVYLKLQERGESRITLLLVCLCVYFSSIPTQRYRSRNTEQHFHTCERATWKGWQLLCGWCCVCLLLTPTHRLRPT